LQALLEPGDAIYSSNYDKDGFTMITTLRKSHRTISSMYVELVLKSRSSSALREGASASQQSDGLLHTAYNQAPGTGEKRTDYEGDENVDHDNDQRDTR
jgi:hypothetical protein